MRFAAPFASAPKNLCLGSAETLSSTGPNGMLTTCDQRRLSKTLWDEVWNAHDARCGGPVLVTDDVIRELLDNVEDLHLDALETLFQNEDGTRVTSRWGLDRVE